VAMVDAAEMNGRRVYRVRPAEEVAHALALAYDPFSPDDLARWLSGLNVAAQALEAGDMAKAMVATVLLKVPPLSAQSMAKLARDPTHRKNNPYHKPAHSPGAGQFTDAEGAAGGAATPTAAATNRETQNGADAKAHPWKTRRNREFRNFIAGEEKSTEHRRQTDGYDETGKNGDALGRYQLQKSTALKDIGWIDKRCQAEGDGKQYCTWTAEAAKHGVASDRDFLNNRAAQETALDLVLSRDEAQARSKVITIKESDGSERRVSLWDLAQQERTYADDAGDTVKITPAGVIAAAHRGGADKPAKFMDRVARNGWTTKGLEPFTKREREIARRLRLAQNVPYATSRR
jgi:hypothetical protein